MNLKREQTIELSVFVASLCVYLALAAWMTANWKPLGDEPHYLLAAHSLVFDRDLDLANNYAQGDFQNFVQGETLDPHVKLLADGTQILNHDLALPIMLALPYSFGGRAGVEFFLAFCAALLAWQIFKLAFDVTHSPLWSGLSWFALAFTPPLILYAALIYPETVGALLFLWSTRTILFRSIASISRLDMVGVALAVVLLPWFSIRFVILSVLLVVFVVVQWRSTRSAMTAILLASAVSFGIYFLVNSVLLAGQVPRGNPTDLAAGNLATLSAASLTRGVVGWWIDPQRGTLIMSPIYILALAGIPRLLRADRRVGILLLSPLLILIPLVAMLGGFWIPFEVGARYFIVALPLLAAPLALALRAGWNYRAHWARPAFAGLTIFLLGLSFWHGALMLTDASYAYGSVVSAYSRAFGRDVSPLFAGMGRGLVIRPTQALESQPDSVARVEEWNGEPVWRAVEGDAGTLLQSVELTELTVGHYAIRLGAMARGATTGAEVLFLDVYSAEGLPLVHASWRDNDLSADSPLPVSIEFDNPYFDRWGFPLSLQLATTGESELVLTAIRFDPDNPTTWLRAGIWLALVVGIVVVLNLGNTNTVERRDA